MNLGTSEGMRFGFAHEGERGMARYGYKKEEGSVSRRMMKDRPGTVSSLCWKMMKICITVTVVLLFSAMCFGESEKL